MDSDFDKLDLRRVEGVAVIRPRNFDNLRERARLLRHLDECRALGKMTRYDCFSFLHVDGEDAITLHIEDVPLLSAGGWLIQPKVYRVINGRTD